MLLIGCGGGDNGSESTANGSGGQAEGESASSGSDNVDTSEFSAEKTEFVSEGNNLCARVIAKIQLQGKKVFNETTGGSGNPKNFGPRLINEVIVPRFNEEINGLQELEAPAGEEAQVDAVVKEIENAVKYIETHPNDDKTYPYKKAEAVADSYGLTNCGQPALEEE